MNRDTNQDGQDKSGFCKKLWSNYRELVKVKQSLDLRRQESDSLLEIKAEIESCRDRTVEFYNLFGLKAVDDFFKLVGERLGSVTQLDSEAEYHSLEKLNLGFNTRRITDLLPAFYLYLDQTQIELIKEKIESLDKKNFDKEYIELQIAYYENNEKKFRQLLLDHIEKYSIGLIEHPSGEEGRFRPKCLEYEYHFDKIQLVSQAISFRELFSDEEKDEIKGFFVSRSTKLFLPKGSSKDAEFLIDSFSYLKIQLNKILSKEQQNIDLKNLINHLYTKRKGPKGVAREVKYNLYQPNLENLNFSLDLEILINLWDQFKEELKDNQNFKTEIVCIFLDIFEEYENILSQDSLKKDENWEKDFLFFTAKLHLMLFKLSQNKQLDNFIGFIQNSLLNEMKGAALPQASFAKLFSNDLSGFENLVQRYRNDYQIKEKRQIMDPDLKMPTENPLSYYLRNVIDTSGLFDLNKMNYANVIGLMQFNRERRMRLTKH
jgi:hypothetical protein